MTTHTNNNGLAHGQHHQPQPNLYGGYPLVDLNTWEFELEGLVDARMEVEAAIANRLLGPGLPHSPAIDKAIALLPIQDKVALLHTMAEREYHEFQASGATVLRAIEDCSAALAVADALIIRFVLDPSKIAPAWILGAATGLRESGAQLEALDPTSPAELTPTKE